MRLAHLFLALGVVGAVFAGCGPEGSEGGPTAALDGASSTHKALAPQDALSGRVIVRFGDDGLKTRRDAAAMSQRVERNTQRIERLGGRLIHQFGSVNAVAAELSADQVTALRADARVALVEQDPIREPFMPLAMRKVTPSAETVPYGIGMVEADQLSDATIANRKICIIDSGYDGTHQDLRPAPGSSVTGHDGNGLGNDTGEWFHDGRGHGTHVAGTISALHNDAGVVGVTGRNEIGLHIVKVFDERGTWAYGSDLVVAVEQCRAAGANVISMSLGGSEASSIEQAAFDDAYAHGVLSIAAAGNWGESWLAYPASYASVVSVAAIDESKTVAYFSQHNEEVEIAAPGVGVLSTTPGNGYEAWDGTSMATPHVSGVAALVWSTFPDCSAAAIRNALTASAEDLGAPGRDFHYGYGLVRAKAAFDYLEANGCSIPDPPPPPPPPEFEELLNGVPVNGMSGSQGTGRILMIDIPAGAANLSLNLSGGWGDADLYVRSGAVPEGAWDCGSATGSNYESCFFASPTPGRYYVRVYAYRDYSDVQLLGTYTKEGCTSKTFTATGLPLTIPDHNAVGVRATVTSDREGTIGSVFVSSSIAHSYRGDLVVTLIAPNSQSYVLAKRAGGPLDNLNLDTDVSTMFTGAPAAGDWQLVVQDRGPRNVGTLERFEVTITSLCQ